MPSRGLLVLGVLARRVLVKLVLAVVAGELLRFRFLEGLLSWRSPACVGSCGVGWWKTGCVVLRRRLWPWRCNVDGLPLLYSFSSWWVLRFRCSS
ncbi:unnamed protein product [Brassica oleracea var. botrytis]